MSDKIFDLKNDRRLSVYLYRMGFGLWLLYILMGANFLHEFILYRTHCAVMCAVCMVFGLTASMYYDYHHHPQEFEQRKKWLIISYLVLGVVIYFLVLKSS